MIEPETEAGLAAAVAGVAGPLVIRGGGTRGVGRPVAGEVLSTRRLSGIVLYEPGALTLVAQAGTPLADIEATLAAEGQALAFEPMDHRGLLGTAGAPTIGGVVAANVSGPRRVRAGAARDFLLGVRFVDGTGAVVKNGGRVMKNVTGYDLSRLMAGSHGTLGVLTEVALKVLPRPAAAASLVIEGLSEADAVAAMAVALGSPFEVSGAAHLAGETMLRLEGSEASVAYRAGALAGRLSRFGALAFETDPAAVAARWAAVRDVAAFHGVPGDVWRLAARPSDAPRLVAGLGAVRVIYDWGGGLVWALCPEGEDLRARMGGVAGHATLVRASEATRARIAPFPPESAAVAALSAGLRRRFDPRSILNPGLMD